LTLIEVIFRGQCHRSKFKVTWWEVFLFSYRSTLHSDVYVLNGQMAAPRVHTTRVHSVFLTRRSRYTCLILALRPHALNQQLEKGASAPYQHVRW